MRRGKRRVTVTGKMFLQAREDKYWTTWAEQRVAKVQAQEKPCETTTTQTQTK